MYGASLLFSLVTHTDVFRTAAAETTGAGDGTWTVKRAVTVLGVVGVLVALESELLVGALEPAVRSFGVSKLWVGLILVPIVGNAAEHSTAVTVALKGQIDLAIDIAVGSSGQVALLVAPILVLAGLGFGHHLTLQFTPFEIGALVVAVFVVALLVLDGLSNWLEGAQLLGVYGIIAVASFFLGKA
jgi:Ca2+:H+ antiporter